MEGAVPPTAKESVQISILEVSEARAGRRVGVEKRDRKTMN